MSVLLIAVAVPIYLFYLLAMVQFQGEIRKLRRNTPVNHQTIVLRKRDEGFEQDARIRQTSSTEREKQLTLSLTWDSSWNDADAPENEFSEAPEVYQFESAYFGPFLIVPLPKTRARTMTGDDHHSGLFPSGA